MEYHIESRTYHARFDQAIIEASMAVVAALSDVMGVDPTAMEPLGRVVDTDALDALVDDGGTSDLSVTFTVGWYEVRVSTDGLITVAERNRPGGPTAGRN